ncbi:MAG TPA: ADP-forming succinate--CoA ligase subunit beta [Candidatus Paceibacterota bacterium]|nr:ADP-forming succinate--CoA ligase subunit beta [Verrucomicrobiota bacterium]HRY49864.1 ADP-forming succinate--CoA ligase subunit beta [Candidatus Paceibacterota bacterium]
MNLHEYQAKQLLANHGVAVPAGGVCTTAQKARSIAVKLFAEGQKRVIVKSQIHAGGRGKGRFVNGLQGGVKICDNSAEVYAYAKAMLGQVLVTKQTGPQGRLVNKILVESALTIQREIFVAVILDRSVSLPVMMVCPSGGVDIEEVAAKHPEKIIREHIDPVVGLMPYQARKLALALGLRNELLPQAVKLFTGVYHTWWDCDATLVEINPLHVVEHLDGNAALVAVDGKISLDDNALYRHPELQAMRDLAEESPLEVEASNYTLSYIKLAGTIACLVNGAGLAMATMDIIQYFGGQPANFLDVGGGARQEQVAAAFKIILSDPSVKAILVNIFGGIMQCDIIAQGIVAAVKETHLKLPLVIRLEGTNSDLGRKILEDSDLPVISATTLADAAEKAVKAAQQESRP